MSYFIVETMAGNTLLPGKTFAYFKRGEVFVRRCVDRLKPGDMVLYEKEFTRKRLDEIEKSLMHVPRYRAAKAILHEKNNIEEYIPRLRTQLIRGLYENEIDEAIKRKLMKEAGDFSENEYHSMTDRIHKLLVESSTTPVVTQKTIRCWLEGKVISPRDKLTYKVLAKINPDFEREYKSHFPDGPASNFYDLYVIIRTGIMRYITENLGKDKTNRKKKFHDKKYILSPEIAAVMEDIADDIDKRFAAVRIHKVKRLDARESKTAHKRYKHKQHLHMGIYHDNTEPPGINVLKLEDIQIKHIFTRDPYNFSDVAIADIQRVLVDGYGFDPQEVREKFPKVMRNLLDKITKKIENIIHNFPVKKDSIIFVVLDEVLDFPRDIVDRFRAKTYTQDDINFLVRQAREKDINEEYISYISTHIDENIFFGNQWNEKWGRMKSEFFRKLKNL